MATARNYLQEIMQNPGSFQGSPGYQFGRDQALQGASRSAAARGMRGSGNVLAELSKLGAGYAAQDYGNEVDRRMRAAGMEQEGEIANRGLDLQGELGRGRLGLDRELGQGQLALGQRRLGLDRELGRGRLDLEGELGRGRLGVDAFRAGTDRDLGMGQLDNARENNWWNYSLGRDRNNLAASGQENDFRLNSGRLGLDWYRAGTDRGSARSADQVNRWRFQPQDPWSRF